MRQSLLRAQLQLRTALTCGCMGGLTSPCGGGAYCVVYEYDCGPAKTGGCGWWCVYDREAPSTAGGARVEVEANGPVLLPPEAEPDAEGANPGVVNDSSCAIGGTEWEPEVEVEGPAPAAAAACAAAACACAACAAAAVAAVAAAAVAALWSWEKIRERVTCKGQVGRALTVSAIWSQELYVAACETLSTPGCQDSRARSCHW